MYIVEIKILLYCIENVKLINCLIYILGFFLLIYCILKVYNFLKLNKKIIFYEWNKNYEIILVVWEKICK